MLRTCLRKEGMTPIAQLSISRCHFVKFFFFFRIFYVYNTTMKSFIHTENMRNSETLNTEIGKSSEECIIDVCFHNFLGLLYQPVSFPSTLIAHTHGWEWGKGRSKQADQNKQKLEEPICTVCPQTRKSALTRNLPTGTPILHFQTPKLHGTWFLFPSPRSWPPFSFLQDTSSFRTPTATTFEELGGGGMECSNTGH